MIRAGNYDQALPYIENALTECPRAADAREAALCTAIFSENRADVREHRGDLAGAETDLRVLLRQRGAVLPPLDPLMAEAHWFLAQFYQRQGRRADEANELLAAERIDRAGGPAGRPRVITAVAYRARALDALNRRSEALPLYQDAYAMSAEQYGPWGVDTLRALNNLCYALNNAGFNDDAARLAEAALRAPEVKRYDPTQRARLAGDLAMNIQTPSQYDDARGFAEAALPWLDTGAVTDRDAVFALLHGLTRLTIAPDPDRAVLLSRRTRVMAAASWGPGSSAVVIALRDEAQAETRRQGYTAAIALLDQAAGLSQALGDWIGRANVEVDRASALQRSGRSDEAVAGDLALAHSQAMGSAAPAVKAAVLTVLGENLTRLHDDADAGALCELAAKTGAAETGAGLADLSYTYRVRAELCRGSALVDMRHPEEALAAAERARDVLWGNMVRQAGVEPRLESQRAIAELRGRALNDSGRHEEAVQVMRERIDLDRRLGDTASEARGWAALASAQIALRRYAEASESVTNGLGALGPALGTQRAELLARQAAIALAQAKPAEAVTAGEQVVALYQAAGGGDEPDLADAERDLATALARTGRYADAGAHEDAAIALFRTLGPPRRTALIAALEWRGNQAITSGDRDRAEAAYRELLGLRGPDSEAAAVTRLTLANLLESEVRRQEADSLRAEALASVVARFGADSVAAMGTRLRGVGWLRANGRQAEAWAVVHDCLAMAPAHDALMRPCLVARAETELEEGAYRDAAASADQAVAFIEAHWDQYGAGLREALTLRARCAAALGDVAGLVRLYDRIHDLAVQQGSGRASVDESYVALMTQAGEPSAALPLLDRVAVDAAASGDVSLRIAVTRQQADHLIATGAGLRAMAAWAPILPLLDNKAKANRAAVLEGLAKASAALARPGDAARLYAEAADQAGQAFGPGAPDYGRLVAAQALALARAGQIPEAEAVVGRLRADPAPATAILVDRTLEQIAEEADDGVAATQLARTVVERTRAAYGDTAVVTAFARLDLATVQLLFDKHVNETDIDDAADVIQAQEPGWAAKRLVLRVRGILALRSGAYDDAARASAEAEALVTAHVGPDSLDVALERSNRAAVLLQSGDAAGADVLFRQALAIASPSGEWHNTVWARIAPQAAAAAAAERIGDEARAVKLRHDASILAPRNVPVQTQRWL